MSGPFNKGDRVRVLPLKGDSGRLTVGRVYTVQRDQRQGDRLVQIKDDQKLGEWYATRFELVPETTGIKPNTQLGKVLALTNGQGSWTLAGIAAATGASEAAVSARLRELRTHGYDVTCEKPKGEAQRRYTVRAAAIALPA